jgi:hypothetical protein
MPNAARRSLTRLSTSFAEPDSTGTYLDKLKKLPPNDQVAAARTGQDSRTNLIAVYSVVMGSTVMGQEEAIRQEIRRELAIAKAKRGNDWQVQSIENSWGDTMDDRETLKILRQINRTGSMFARIIGAIRERR